MLGGQPNHGWQLCFPLKLHASCSDLKTYLLMKWKGPDAFAVRRFSVLSTIAQVLKQMNLEIFRILIFYVSFVRDLRLILEGKNMSIQCKWH